MKNVDDIIDEIRMARREISDECEHPPDRVMSYLHSLESKYASQVKRFRHGRKADHYRPEGNAPEVSPEEGDQSE